MDVTKKYDSQQPDSNSIISHTKVSLQVLEGNNLFSYTPLKAVSFKIDWRPRPESNRDTRICSPLRNHSATRPHQQI